MESIESIERAAGLAGWPQPRFQLRRWPKISIITPSFNQAEFLEATIQSILCQNYPNLEYIIIDGGSTDGSVEIIRKYQRHLHYWISEPDGGMYAGIAKGMARATGEILAWLNSDDLYMPWALALVASIMEQLPEVKWISTLQPAGWDDLGLCAGFKVTMGFSRQAFLEGRYLPGCGDRGVEWIQQESTFWRHTLWNTVDKERFTQCSLAGDFYLWDSFFNHTELYGVPCALGGFRNHSQQKTHNGMQQYLNEAEQCLRQARQIAHWKRNLQRETAYRLHANRIPKLRRLVTEQLGYTGKRIVRQSLSSGEWHWAIETYRFL
jgi:glycosyltransferase involved in cell wall biosynthesis